MRKPLTRQNSTRDKRRYSAYQNRIFFYLVTLVTVPLLLLGVLSSVVYYRQTVTRSDALLASARENVETQMEIALSNLRAYYSAVVSADNYQTLCQKTVPPYSEYTLVRDMQTAMRGGNLVDKYVEGYTYINLRSGWILSNNGMYRLADAANRDEVAHLLSEWAEQHAAMMWVNRTDQPTPALADTPLNTVDLTGELLVLRSSSYRTGSYAVLIVKLDLSPLYEMTESWQTGGYSIAARDFTGKTVLSTSAALTALLDADTPAEGGCVLGGWRLNSGKMGVNGLTYYAALPQRTLAATAGMVILIAFVLAGGLVAVLLICRRSTSVLYAPVDDLMHAASGVFGQPGSDEEEFAYLAAGVKQVARDKQAMQSLMQQQNRRLQQSFEENLIRSEVTDEAAGHTMQELGLAVCPAYRLIALALDTPAGTSGPVRETMLLTAIQTMPTELLRRCAFQPVMLNFTLLLVVGGEEADLNEACRVVYTAAARSIRTALGVSCRAGVSRPFHKLHHMQLAAQEAWEALRLPEADAPEASGQMLYYQPPDEQCARNGYDTLLEHEITAAVTACKAKEVRHLLERFTAKMLEKNIRGYERQFYIQRLVAAMLAVAENAGLSVNQVLADRQANLFETIGKIYTADQMQNFLMDEVAVPVMDLLTEFRQSSSSELVKNVLALIKQTRGDITLNECADRLNYNPSYIWKVLRTEKDTSFSDLANNEKLEMAKELLLTSDMTVVQIAETLNYSNVQNFIRFFSKKVGMTPGKYRKDYQNEKK